MSIDEHKMVTGNNTGNNMVHMIRVWLLKKPTKKCLITLKCTMCIFMFMCVVYFIIFKHKHRNQ